MTPQALTHKPATMTDRSPPPSTVALAFIKEFFATSSVHGFWHVSAANRHVFETVLWIGTVLVAAYVSITVSIASVQRYRDSPTVITIERDSFAWNNSFPAATICPTFKYSRTLLQRNKYRTPNRTRFDAFVVSLAQASYHNFDEVVHYDEIASEDYLNLMLSVEFEFRPTISTTGEKAMWFSLTKIVSEMGLCYTFNSKLATYQSPEYVMWHYIIGLNLKKCNFVEVSTFYIWVFHTRPLYFLTIYI